MVKQPPVAENDSFARVIVAPGQALGSTVAFRILRAG
jgi:hypothetical protein